MYEVYFTVIVPHYNRVDLLLKLLSTIPDMDCIEVLVVDDKSTCDLSSVKTYIENRTNIRLLYNQTEKKGAGCCRNIGLQKALGKWLIFADSDDFFLENWVDCVKKYYDCDADMIYFVPHGINLQTGEQSNRHLMYKELVMQYIESPSKKNEIELRACFCTPWSKMIRRSMVERNHFEFDEIMVSNDIMFITKSAFASKKIVGCKDSIYCVTRGGASLTSKKNLDAFMKRVDVVVDRYTYLKRTLTKREFRYAHVNRYALGKLVDVVIEGWGLKVFLNIFNLYIKNRISLFDLAMFNPCILIKVVRYELAWWFEIKRHRKNEKDIDNA